MDTAINTYRKPLDGRIGATLEMVRLKVLDKSVSEEVSEFRRLISDYDSLDYSEFIPVEFIETYRQKYRQQLQKEGYRHRLIVSLAITYCTLTGICTGFDKLRVSGAAVEDSPFPEIALTFEANKKICEKFHKEGIAYMEALLWGTEEI